MRAAGEDVPLLLELFGELAEYEHLERRARATRSSCSEALFGERPAAEALIAERGGEAVGYALFFPTFSSFLASQGIWLEDLFVRPAHRGAGVGRALLAAVAARVRERGASAWNGRRSTGTSSRSASIGALGAQTMGEWITHRLDGEALRALRGGGRRACRGCPRR